VERFKKKEYFMKIWNELALEPSRSCFSSVRPVSSIAHAAPARHLRRGAGALLVARGALPTRPWFMLMPPVKLTPCSSPVKLTLTHAREARSNTARGSRTDTARGARALIIA
jgi:hypothetical protein